MDKSIVVPLGLFISVVYSIKLLVDARMRYLFFKGDSPDAVRALMQGEARMRRMASLRWGVMLTALACGLALNAALRWPPVSVEAIAMVLAWLGLGNLAAFAAAHQFDRALPLAAQNP